MAQSKSLNVSENHKRAISSSLILLDQMLCEAEQIANGRESRSVLYEERNALSPEQRERLLAEISTMREMLSEIKTRLGLRAQVENLSRVIWARSSGLWPMLVETQSRHLKGYGEVPPELAGYLDPAIERLIDHLISIADLAGPRRTQKWPAPAGKGESAHETKKKRGSGGAPKAAP